MNPSMEVEGRKKQSLSSSTVEAQVKEQYVANKGETLGPRGPPVLYATPPHQGNHEMHMGAGQMVHGGEYVTLKRGLVPASAANPTTLDAIKNPIELSSAAKYPFSSCASNLMALMLFL
ncbi:hypothetical protein SO802_013804 [Lithocarpus litseifolius]|uniref:Uncharacterized protein n=1 Tax=Lithocarpus litseifolius TaxID=425828 RepID=A0AAW2D6L5_9ROSI